MKNGHSVPTAEIQTFPQKLGDADTGGVQQNSVGVHVGRGRAESEAPKRKVHSSLCFWLFSCFCEDNGMELGCLLRSRTDASCSPKTVQRGWQLFELSCYVFPGNFTELLRCGRLGWRWHSSQQWRLWVVSVRAGSKIPHVCFQPWSMVETNICPLSHIPNQAVKLLVESHSEINNDCSALLWVALDKWAVRQSPRWHNVFHMSCASSEVVKHPLQASSVENSKSVALWLWLVVSARSDSQGEWKLCSFVVWCTEGERGWV